MIKTFFPLGLAILFTLPSWAAEVPIDEVVADELKVLDTVDVLTAEGEGSKRFVFLGRFASQDTLPDVMCSINLDGGAPDTKCWTLN